MEITALGSFPKIPHESTAKLSEGPGVRPFEQVISGVLDSVKSQQAQADQSVNNLVTGKAENLHDVMLSVSKADLNFRMVVEIRNRLTDAYQEIMRMQV
jgi:flagellar hook-basal body complex protein FliE